jgi:hypothetical protein
MLGVAALMGSIAPESTSYETTPHMSTNTITPTEVQTDPQLHPNFSILPTPGMVKTPAAEITPTTIPSLLPTTHNKTVTLLKPKQSGPEKTKPVLAPLPIMNIPKPVVTPRPTATTEPTISPTESPNPVETSVPTPQATTSETTQPTPVETKGHISLHPENLLVTESIKTIMDRNVVHIPDLGCSGFLLRNKAGEAIGVRTAEHCSLLPKDGHWSTVIPNKPVIFNFEKPLIVNQGTDFKTEQTIGTITQLIVNGPSDNRRDNAFGVFANSSPEEVLANSQQMTPEEIDTLKTGDVIYNSGFPLDQKLNNGPTKRQDFAMTVLGKVEWQITNGESLKLVVAAVPLSKDGAECSWGNSGSQAFIQRPDGSIGIIGSASAFNDFGNLYNGVAAGAAERADAESYFGVDLSGYVALCGFAYETPTPEAGMIVGSVNVVDQLPITETPPTIYDKTREYVVEKFQDSTHDRTIIDGIVEVATGKGGFYVQRPEIIYDADTGIYSLVSYGSELKGHTAITVLQNLSVLRVYTGSGQTPNIAHEVGAITDTGTDFVLENGHTFGNNGIQKGDSLNGAVNIDTDAAHPTDYQFVLPGKD